MKHCKTSETKILNVTDFHIGALYSGINITPDKFLQIAKTSANLEDFITRAELPARSPLCVLTKQLRIADSLVLTGDMIEFINQGREDDEYKMQTVGLEFHRMLLASANGKNVYEVLGNHERLRRYEKALDKLEDEYPNYHVNHSHFLIGDALFIHGDRDLTPHSMEGEKAYEKRNRERHRHADDHLLHTVGNTYVPGVMHMMPNVHATLEKILSPLFPGADPLLYTTANQLALIFHNVSARLRDIFKPVKHVFLGHTHIPYTHQEYEFRGRKVTFHNSGGSLKSGLNEFKPLMITMRNEVVTGVEVAGHNKSSAMGL